jgi:hypothetical protein
MIRTAKLFSVTVAFLLADNAYAQDYSVIASQLPCTVIGEELRRVQGNSFRIRGFTGTNPASIPAIEWDLKVLEAFKTKALQCAQERTLGISGDSATEILRRIQTGVLQDQKANAELAAKKQFQEQALLRARVTEIAELDRTFADAEAASSSAQLQHQISVVQQKVKGSANLIAADIQRYANQMAKLEAKLSSLRIAEAEAWERDRPNREAKASAQKAEIAGQERLNQQLNEAKEAERQRAATLDQLKTDAQTEEIARQGRLRQQQTEAAEAERQRLAALDQVRAEAQNDEIARQARLMQQQLDAAEAERQRMAALEQMKNDVRAAEIARLREANQLQEAAERAERERAALVEYERQAPARAKAAEEARLALAQKELEAAAQAEADAKAAGVIRAQREQEARAAIVADEARQKLARQQAEALEAADTCNAVSNKKMVMDTVNSMDAIKVRGLNLIDITKGRTIAGAATQTCRYDFFWSNKAVEGYVVYVKRNSIGEPILMIDPE